MSEQAYLILVSLAGGSKHGYGVMTDVRELSAGRVALGAGTLYGVLQRLVDGRLVNEAREEVVDGRMRRYYELTDSGLDAIRVESDRLERTARLGRSRLAGGTA